MWSISRIGLTEGASVNFPFNELGQCLSPLVASAEFINDFSGIQHRLESANIRLCLFR